MFGWQNWFRIVVSVTKQSSLKFVKQLGFLKIQSNVYQLYWVKQRNVVCITNINKQTKLNWLNIKLISQKHLPNFSYFVLHLQHYWTWIYVCWNKKKLLCSNEKLLINNLMLLMQLKDKALHLDHTWIFNFKNSKTLSLFEVS